jgi:xanthine/uracil permease
VSIKYGLEDRLDNKKTATYGLQHMILFIANSAIMPVIIAKGFGLENQEISDMLLRTFLLCGILSIIQTRLGHRYPIIEGPSGLWLTVWISLASITSAMGGELAHLRSSLEMGMLISGVLIVALGLSGQMKYIAKLFSPLVNGVFLVLMPVQLSRSFVAGMFGTVYGGSEIDPQAFAVFWLTVVVMLIINIKGTPFLKSIAILIGVAVGWVFAVLIGAGDFGDMSSLRSFLVLPQPLAWGLPTFDAGIVITCVMGSFLLFANVIASFLGTAEVIGEEFTEKQLDRGTMCFGFSTVMTGLFATIGFVPFATSMGIIRMTGVATRKPFYLGSVAMIVLGLLGPVGLFFAAIPPSVGYGALLVLFAVIIKQGFDNFTRARLTEKLGFAVGISMMAGSGIMMQPFAVFANLPDVIVPFVSNGLLVGVILAIIFEQLLKERPQIS